jgi:adenosylcobinamide kinase/adenosylcobinamide-phosphate guanylyltransferase
LKNLVLITGGAKSGKSEFAERLASSRQLPVVYLATMPFIEDDLELLEKIRRHRQRRPSSWQTVEADCHVDQAVVALKAEQSTCILDCLSLFVSNLIYARDRLSLERTAELVSDRSRALLAAMQARTEIEFVVVTNEVGWGIVPDNALARLYRDVLGEVNQDFAGQAQTVWLSCAGLQIKLKPTL